MIPGTYDILYRRGESSTAGTVLQTAPSDPFAHGLRTLMTGVAIGPGDNTLNVDLASARVTGTVTLNGAPVPSVLNDPTSWDVELFAVSQDTGAHHRIALLEYVYNSSYMHPLRPGTDVIDTRLVPGTYDILYRRGESSTPGLVLTTRPTDPFAHGLRTIGACLDVR